MERRLAAILSADVVGYPRLMEADEAGMLERLKALRAEAADPVIAAHGGRIVKPMGDGALVERAGKPTLATRGARRRTRGVRKPQRPLVNTSPFSTRRRSLK